MQGLNLQEVTPYQEADQVQLFNIQENEGKSLIEAVKAGIKPGVTGKHVSKRIANIAAIRELKEQGHNKKEIAKLLNLSEPCVYKHLKFIKESNLADPKTVNLAYKALQYNLKENKSLEAVKMVYNHINEGSTNVGNGRNSTTININFDGLSNTQGEAVITGKIAGHEQSINKGITIEGK